jgi:hypothetical protein
MQPTAEQQAVASAIVSGQSVCVQAYAGTGKTQTLVEAVRQLGPGHHCLYLAFNRVARLDAQARLPPSAEAQTLHSLAYRRVPRSLRQRQQIGWSRARAVAEVLGLSGGMTAGAHPLFIGHKVADTLRRYCLSDDATLGMGHVDDAGLSGIAEERQGELREIIATQAQRLWEISVAAGSTVPVEPDVVLKCFALQAPDLTHAGHQTILLDEAQDTSPVAVGLLRRQRSAQVVVVGDPYQQLYAWRGAVDAMTAWQDCPLLRLTGSFRFGAALADPANVVLADLDAAELVRGLGQPGTLVGPGEYWAPTSPRPYTELCRSNMGVLAAGLAALRAGKRPFLVGAFQSVARFLRAALSLHQGGSARGDERLAAYSHWSELTAAAEQSRDPELRRVVSLVEQRGGELLADLECLRLGQAASMDAAEVICATVHQAKGLEWPVVRLGTDFGDLTTDSVRPARWADCCALYVGLTRAREVLDPGPAVWSSLLAMRSRLERRVAALVSPVTSAVPTDDGALAIEVAEPVEDLPPWALGESAPPVTPAPLLAEPQVLMRVPIGAVAAVERVLAAYRQERDDAAPWPTVSVTTGVATAVR